MKNLMTIMVSIVVVLMLGCSAFVSTSAHSSHSENIDTLYFKASTSHLTGVLTDIMTDTAEVIANKSQDEYNHYFSQFFAKTLDYVSQTSKVSCTNKEIIAKTICDIALDNDIDICFILAQGTIETHLGTTGIGKSRHSIFGVYKTYSNYKECIKAYAALLKKSYLTKGRTEKDLMRRYVTANGARYAGNPEYENEISKKYAEISCKYNELHKLQKKLKDNRKKS